MKKLLLLLTIPLLLAGCFRYGDGQAVGHVYSVDDGIVWDHIWIKTSLDSSEADCYIVDDNAIKSALREINGAGKVRLNYKRHLFTVSGCGKDEVTSFVEVTE